jgi:hypothetical protein
MTPFTRGIVPDVLPDDPNDTTRTAGPRRIAARGSPSIAPAEPLHHAIVLHHERDPLEDVYVVKRIARHLFHPIDARVNQRSKRPGSVA